MSWQDAAFGIGQALFALSLLPSVFGERKPEASTSVVTALVLLVFAVAYASLGLWWGCASVLVCAALWAVLAWQVLVPVVREARRYARELEEACCMRPTGEYDGCELRGPGGCVLSKRRGGDEHADGIW